MCTDLPPRGRNKLVSHRPLLWGLFLILCYGCAPKLEEVSPPLQDQPEAFRKSGTAALPDRWWTSFEDPVLDQLVTTALEQNLGLQGSWQGFQAALAVVERESSRLWPQVDASARAGISRPEPDFSGGEDLQLGLGASYEIDLWGRIRAGVQAEEFRARATYQDYQAAAMTLSAETAITWMELLTAKKQLQLAQQQIETNQNITRLIRARFAGGQVRAVDILRQEQLLENTRDQRLFYETRVQTLEHRLAVILGRAPQNLESPEEADLPALPPLPETGLPLELIRRRPDVQQAYLEVLASDRDWAEAVRAKYPRISLDLVGQARSNTYENLFQDWAYTLAGNILAPLFYGGRLQAETDRTQAIKQQQLYQYGQVVLRAFQEVEDALVREENQKRRIEVLERRLELIAKTNDQLRNEFLNGMSDYLDVLLSLEQQQELQRQMLSAKSQLLIIRIELYRALAGAIESEPMQNPKSS